MKPAAAYVRMSSDRQEASPEQQREAIAKLAAKHGCTIVCEYFDSGISGDATEKRKEFQRMIADAGSGTFKVILAYDQDRFGRFNSIEAGFYIHPLMQAGVELVTVAQGRIDWQDFAGRLVYQITQEGKHAFLKDLARNTMRGKLAAVRRGEWISRAPYGYRLENKQLSVVEDRAAVVRRMFDLAAAGNSLRQIAIVLNGEGHKHTSGKPWTQSVCGSMLRNVAYLGTLRYNHKTTGKYVAVKAGDVTTDIQNGVNDESEWIIFDDHHPAIVDRKLFDRVQAALAARQTVTTPHPRGGRFVLTGVLRCAKCGRPMSGNEGRTGKIKYRCVGYFEGRQCDANMTEQTEILERVLAVIEEQFLHPGRLAKLKAELRRQVERQTDAGRVESLRKQLDGIDRKLSKASKRLLECEADMLPVVQDGIRALRAERDAVAARLKAAETPQAKLLREADQRIRRAVDAVANLRDVLTSDPVLLREAVRGLVDTIEVRSEQGRNGRRNGWGLVDGKVNLCSGFSRNLSNSTSSTGSTGGPATCICTFSGRASSAMAAGTGFTKRGTKSPWKPPDSVRR